MGWLVGADGGTEGGGADKLLPKQDVPQDGDEKEPLKTVELAEDPFNPFGSAKLERQAGSRKPRKAGKVLSEEQLQKEAAKLQKEHS